MGRFRADGAAVRIAMTVACAGQHEGKLARVTSETPGGESEFAVELAEELGLIHADLTVGVDVSGAVALRANAFADGHVGLFAPADALQFYPFEWNASH